MAGYNCANSSNSAYGVSSYGTCDTQSVGAPDTGVFQEFIGGASFSIVAPLTVAIVVVVIATVVMKIRKRTTKPEVTEQ
jgi:hypothetical protein